MKDPQEQQIAAQALKALQLRRRLESGALTHEEYLEALNALQQTPPPGAAQPAVEPAQPVREKASGQSRHMTGQPHLLGALEVLQLRRRLDSGQITPGEYLTELQAQPESAGPPVQESAPLPEPVSIQPSAPADPPPNPARAIVSGKLIPERSLAMKCPNCAADVGISDQAKDMRCTDCGAELVVERKDCTIALRLAANLLKESAKSMAPAASAKTGDELKKLRAEAEMVATVKRSAGILGGLCGILFAYMGITDIAAQNVAMGASVLICGSALLGTVVCITRHTTKVRADLVARIRAMAPSEECETLPGLPLR